jgi:excisionase family DNA binding protein
VPSRKKKSTSKLPATVVEPRLLSVKGAATYLSATVWFMRTLVWEKKIPSVKFGNRILFDRADLDAYVERAKVAVTGAE